VRKATKTTTSTKATKAPNPEKLQEQFQLTAKGPEKQLEQEAQKKKQAKQTRS